MECTCKSIHWSNFAGHKIIYDLNLCAIIFLKWLSSYIQIELHETHRHFKLHLANEYGNIGWPISSMSNQGWKSHVLQVESHVLLGFLQINFRFCWTMIIFFNIPMVTSLNLVLLVATYLLLFSSQWSDEIF